MVADRKTQTGAVRAAIYTRISDDRTGEQAGVTRQERDCRALCKRRGWVVVDLYCDNDLSATSGKPRPQYVSMIAELEAGNLDAIVAWHTDRLYRVPKELEHLIDLVEQRHFTIATVQSDLDLSTSDGRAMARVICTFSAKEGDDKSRRLKRKHLELAEQGKVSGGGSRPFGFEADHVTVREAEAVEIRDAVHRVLGGEPVRSICRDWTARGIITPLGNEWSPYGVRRLLSSARVAGFRELEGVRTKAVWPAIVTLAEHERIRAVFADPSRRVNREPRRYLLAGIAVCGLCGAKLVARPRADKRRAYVCARGPGFSGCGRIGALAETLEHFVVHDRLVHAIDDLDLSAALADVEGQDSADDTAADIADLDRRLTELAETWASGDITRAEWLAARKAVEGRLETARRSLVRRTGNSAIEAYVGKPGALAATWDVLTLDQQRTVLTAIVDRVTVSPAVKGRQKFDPDRVEVTWRV